MNQEQEHVFQISVRRRGFIKSALAITAGIGLPEWFLGQDTYGASAEAPKSENDKPGIALIGCGGQGRNDCRWASYFGNVVAVCDVDENHLNAAAEQFEVKAKYKDFRKLLENKDVDVVINGTPDHWHTLVNIASFKAGKDVYGEKPLTLTIDEGRQLLKVYKETKRIFQTGSQQRSGSQFRLACELVRNGRIGKLQHIRVSLPVGRYGGPFQSRPVPSELDWDFWQGQTQVVDYVPERCHGSFRYWLTYSGGTMTDWGAHHLDIAQWGNGTERSGPVEVEGRSLVNMIPGGYNTPSQYH
ncbi:MAG: Gfo/Idh/MocA family oxidoreductase, partial [Verrucomicrobia bacterium]|nr:Gfo/Idh/MocA family oxidoreductase [Verrucomicrobiota bacterium]